LVEALSLCRMLQTRGIDKVIATPHFIGDYDSKVTPESVKEKIDILNKEMKKQHIKLEIYSGMEVFASNDTVDRLEKGEILTLNNSRYVLIEFSCTCIRACLKLPPRHWSLQVKRTTLTSCYAACLANVCSMSLIV